MSKPVLDFAIFCIEGVAEKLQLPGNVVYDLLTRKSRILPDTISSRPTTSCTRRADNTSSTISFHS